MYFINKNNYYWGCGGFMINKNKISIIVPVYNLETYIKNTIESILNQTIFNDLEIIIINDGSTDKTKDICDQYANQYENIILKNQKNEGVSKARNYGLSLVTSPYVLFVDGDDELEDDYCESLLTLVEKYQADIAITDVIIKTPISSMKKSKYDEHRYYSYSDESLIKLFRRDNILPYPVAKLFKAECIKDIVFSENIRLGEDLLFVYQAVKKAKTVIVDTTIAKYYYIQRESSAVHHKFGNKNLELLKVAKLIKENEEKDSLLYVYAGLQEIIIKNDCLESILKDKVKDKYISLYYKLLSDIRRYSIFTNRKYVSNKQKIRLLLTKISPKLSMRIREISMGRKKGDEETFN